MTIAESQQYGTVAPAAIDHFQRSEIQPVLNAAGAGMTTAPAEARRILPVSAVTYELDPRDVPEPGRGSPTTPLLVGLAHYGIPFAFVVEGAGGHVRLKAGVWAAAGRDPATAEALDARLRVMRSLLLGAYVGFETSDAPTDQQPLPLAGLVLGNPAPRDWDPRDPGGPVDRLARAMSGHRWRATILAEPAGDAVVRKIRNRVINELRGVAAAEQAARVPSPLAQHYTDLLGAALDHLKDAHARGGWRTAVYLSGDAVSYPCLASAWRSIFSGAGSLPEPVRIYDDPVVAQWADDWAMPDVAGEEREGQFRHPYASQTLLSSEQLARVAQFPQIDHPGFAVRVRPAFELQPKPASPPRIEVGSTPGVESEPFAIGHKALTRHALVCGVTGSGKTNTLFSLLLQVHEAGIPFLVIEPAKREYRSLLDHPALGGALRVFTPGSEHMSPFRLNPFEVPEGSHVGQHVDLLRAAFGASFGMWAPLPQVLEQALNQVYVDRGWDLRSGVNVRLREGEPRHGTFPTIGELIGKVREIVPALGYDQRIAGDIRAALVTRLESLRAGAKGAMLDVSTSLPIEELLGAPTVIELEGVADDSDKAFVMGLLLIRLIEQRRVMGQSPGLAHVLVIEEAHRLLANVHAGQADAGNARGQAVEMFSHLLSEIRAYGQGVLIADQVPVRLAPDVLKNTNLKIAHRIVANDDRAALAGTMKMNAAQAEYLPALEIGAAAVFADGADGPSVLRVPLIKDAVDPASVTDERVAEHMRAARPQGVPTASPLCPPVCAAHPAACMAARRLLDDPVVQRVLSRAVVTTADEPSAIDRLWPDLDWTIRARCRPGTPEAAVLEAFAGHGAQWLAGRRGAQYGWNYGITGQVAEGLRDVLLAKVADPRAPVAGGGALTAFIAAWRAAHRREGDPFPACSSVCDQPDRPCLYRAPIADAIASGRFDRTWTGAGGKPDGMWKVSRAGAYDVIEFPDAAVPPAAHAPLRAADRRAALCFAQQMLARDQRKHPRTIRALTAGLVEREGGSTVPSTTSGGPA